MKTINYKIANAMRTLAISFAIVVSLSGFAKGAASTTTSMTGGESAEISMNHTELAGQMETWLNNSTYWNGEETSEAQELVSQMRSWMDNRSFWSDDAVSQEPELALQMKNWLSEKSLWSVDEDNQGDDLNFQVKSWIGNTAFWSGSEVEVPFGNQLASN